CSGFPQGAMMAEEGMLRIGGSREFAGLAQANMPDGSLAMQLVITAYPVTDEQRAVRSHGDAHRPKVLAALHKGLALRLDRSALLGHDVPLDAVIGPRGHE